MNISPLNTGLAAAAAPSRAVRGAQTNRSATKQRAGEAASEQARCLSPGGIPGRPLALTQRRRSSQGAADRRVSESAAGNGPSSEQPVECWEATRLTNFLAARLAGSCANLTRAQAAIAAAAAAATAAVVLV